jgi:hypothetical protein
LISEGSRMLLGGMVNGSFSIRVGESQVLKNALWGDRHSSQSKNHFGLFLIRGFFGYSDAANHEPYSLIFRVLSLVIPYSA